MAGGWFEVNIGKVIDSRESSKMMVVVILTAVFVVYRLYPYAKWLWRARSLAVLISQYQQRQHDATKVEEEEEEEECAVCLSQISPGEKLLLLPKCNHAFHLDCIHPWLQYHSTCPLCRNLLILLPAHHPAAFLSNDFTSLFHPLSKWVETQLQYSDPTF